ncbi:MAG: 50S ribosomal protein L30 [Nitrospirota bacterium]
MGAKKLATAARTKSAGTGFIAITLVRSPIGRPAKHKLVVKGLGFRKLQQTVIRPDTPAIRGMVNEICHMVRVEPHTGERA